MAYSCEHCGQTTLETDTVCWQCGQTLAPRQPKPVTPPSDENGTMARPFSLARLAAYGGMTLFIIIALFAVMRSLGRQPQAAQGLGDSLKPGWTAVTDYNRAFSLNLPAAWLWLDRFNPDQEVEFIEQVRQNGQFQAALAPYDALADDRQLLFLGAEKWDDGETAAAPFVVVIGSRQLGQFTSEQMTLALADSSGDVTLLRSNLVEGTNGRRHLLLNLTLPYADQTLRCQHLFYQEAAGSFLVAACAPEDQYSDFTNIFHDILISFQSLLS